MTLGVCIWCRNKGLGLFVRIWRYPDFAVRVPSHRWGYTVSLYLLLYTSDVRSNCTPNRIAPCGLLRLQRARHWRCTCPHGSGRGESPKRLKAVLSVGPKKFALTGRSNGARSIRTSSRFPFTRRRLGAFWSMCIRSCVTKLEQFLPRSTWVIDSPLNTAWFKLWKSVHFHRPPLMPNHDLQRTGKSSGVRKYISQPKACNRCSFIRIATYLNLTRCLVTDP